MPSWVGAGGRIQSVLGPNCPVFLMAEEEAAEFRPFQAPLSAIGPFPPASWVAISAKGCKVSLRVLEGPDNGAAGP